MNKWGTRLLGVHQTFNALPPRNFESLWWELDPSYEAGRLHVIEYVIEGESGGVWHVEIASDADLPPPRNCKVLEGPAESPALQLTLEADDWLSIMSGQASPYSLLASGRLRAEGNQSLIGDLNFLGLLGQPPEDVDLEPYRSERWVETPSWVLPRVVFAGRVDYDKWRYFSEQKHEIKARPAWKPLLWVIPLFSSMITKLACQDEALFRFAIDHSLIQIIPYWHDRTAS